MDNIRDFLTFRSLSRSWIRVLEELWKLFGYIFIFVGMTITIILSIIGWIIEVLFGDKP